MHQVSHQPNQVDTRTHYLQARIFDILPRLCKRGFAIRRAVVDVVILRAATCA